MAVSLSLLRALEAVARRGSFSRAADELRLTQPAVSMQIRQLESDVGLPLLERVGKRAYPTAAGEILLGHAARARAELESGLERLQAMRGVVAGRLRIGTSVGVSIYLLPPALRDFRIKHRATELIVVNGTAADIARRVIDNDLDVGVVNLPIRDRELLVTPFHHDELVAIAPPQAPWRGRRRIAPAELARQSLILFDHGSNLRRTIDGWFQQAGVAVGAALELGNTEAMKKLVEAGLGLSIASHFSVRADVRAGTLVAISLDPPLMRQIGIIRRRGKPLAPPLAAFLAELELLKASLDRRRAARRRR